MRCAPAARGAHLEQLALALRQLLHDDAGVALIDVDDDLFDRLQLGRRRASVLNTTLGRETVSSKPSRRMFSIRMASCNSPRPATSKASLSSETRDLDRDVALGFLHQAIADDAALHLVAFLAGERAVVDAEGHRQRRRIDRLRGQRRLDAGSHSVSATVASLMPAMATISPASACSTGVRSRPRKASTFCTRKFSTTSPSRLSAFSGWPGLEHAGA